MKQLDFLSPYTCAHCGKHGATWKFRADGPDTSWECWRYYCSNICLANHGTNQPVNAGQEGKCNG